MARSMCSRLISGIFCSCDIRARLQPGPISVTVLNETSSRQLGPGSRDTLGLLEGDEGSPFRRMEPAEGAELSLLGWT